MFVSAFSLIDREINPFLDTNVKTVRIFSSPHHPRSIQDLTGTSPTGGNSSGTQEYGTPSQGNKSAFDLQEGLNSLSKEDCKKDLERRYGLKPTVTYEDVENVMTEDDDEFNQTTAEELLTNPNYTLEQDAGNLLLKFVSRKFLTKLRNKANGINETEIKVEEEEDPQNRNKKRPNKGTDPRNKRRKYVESKSGKVFAYTVDDDDDEISEDSDQSFSQEDDDKKAYDLRNKQPAPEDSKKQPVGQCNDKNARKGIFESARKVHETNNYIIPDEGFPVKEGKKLVPSRNLMGVVQGGILLGIGNYKTLDKKPPQKLQAVIRPGHTRLSVLLTGETEEHKAVAAHVFYQLWLKFKKYYDPDHAAASYDINAVSSPEAHAKFLKSNSESRIGNHNDE